MSRPTNLELLPPWANVIDASPPVAFSVEVEVPGPSVYVIPADEMPTFPAQRMPGEVDFWAQVDFSVRQKIIAPQDVALGGNVDLVVVSAVRLPAAAFGFEVTFSVESSFRYIRTVQFSGAAALEAASVVQLPAAFTGSGELAVESAVNLPALFGGEVTLSVESEGGFQIAEVDFAGEVTFSVESRVQFVRTVDFSASVALAAAVFERYVRSVDFAGNATLAVSQFPKAPLGVGFGGNASLSISAPIPVIPREVGFGGNVTLSIAAELGFRKSGMIKGSDQDITSTTAVLVTGMSANANLPGSTVTSDALVSAYAGSMRIGFALHAVTSGGAEGRAAVFKNGVQVGATFALYVPYNGPAMITGTVSTTVAIGDQITLRFWEAAASAMTIKGTTTRLNISEGSSITVGGSVASNYTPAVGWTDVPLVADSGTTLSGNAIVVPAAHPNAILAANVDINSEGAMSVRFLVNGVVVYTGPATPAYNTRAIGSVGYALAAGDLVTMQVQRISTFATTVAAGSKFTII